ncbi:MAG TPA: glycosyltransferase family 4 protein [Rhizomicrobium sp.]|nr:glycosyltransferase family 4 protein [Rhizomicrobium sp.]
MSVHINELVEALRARGHEVRIVGPSGSEPRPGERRRGSLEAAADLARSFTPSAAFEAIEIAYNLYAYKRLMRAATQFRPDVLYERYNLFLTAGLRAKRKLGIPMLLEINSPLAAERARFGNLFFARASQRSEEAIWRGCDAALVVTEVLASSVRRARCGELGVHVIPNGARTIDFPPAESVARTRQRFGLSPDDVVLGFAGFVRSWHGLEWAIDALADLPPQARLLIVGDGPAIGELAAKAKAQGLDRRVHFAGRTPHEEMPAVLQTFDVALQPACVAYASPLKLFEYMACGLAVIAPDQPNIREVLKDGETALLFRPGDPNSFAKAIGAVCADRALRARLGQAAREAILRTPFTWSHNAERITAIAENLISARASS